MGDGTQAPAHPAATVVLLRDGDAGCEVLLVRRNSRLAFHGGAWVFPGGRIDEADYERAGSADDVHAAARLAAAREAFEEAGVSLIPEELTLFARWVTPEGLPKRFDAWFFAGRATEEMVRVDGGEIDDHRWMRPDAALAAQRAGEIELPPPTFVTLTQFVAHVTVEEALHDLTQRPLRSYFPRLYMLPTGGACSLYEGDAGYEGGDPECAGARHRLWMHGDGSWSYEHSDAGLRLRVP